MYPEFKKSMPLKNLEKTLPLPAKYLLKYDRIKFMSRVYSIDKLNYDDLSLSDLQKKYILLKSRQRLLCRLNYKINKLNKYYETPTELWARFVELYFTDAKKTKEIAPNIYNKFKQVVESNMIQELTFVNKILL